MKTTRWIASAVAIVIASGVSSAAWPADAPATTSAPPDKTVGMDDGTNNSKADTASAKPAPAKPATKPATTPKPDDDDKNGDFKPSEEISEDMAVAYPTDI
jgi:hypothetical protein